MRFSNTRPIIAPKFGPCGEAVAWGYLERDSREAHGLRDLFRREGGVVLEVTGPVTTFSAMEGHLPQFDLPELLRCPLGGDVAPLNPRVALSLHTLRDPIAGRVWAC